MNLIKTSLMSGISVVIKVITLLGLNKVLAIYVGPAGYAAIGQLQNVIQVITGVMTGTISNGVTSLTAERDNDLYAQKKVWATAGLAILVFSLITSLLIYLFRVKMSLFFFGDLEFQDAFLYFSFTLIFFVSNVFLQSILNGRKEVTKYVTSNIIGSLASVVVVSILTINLGLYGAMLGLVTYQSVTFFSTLYICSRCEWFTLRGAFAGLDKDILKNLGKYFVMALSSAILAPLVQIVIRGHLTAEINVVAAGHWEAVWRLSSAYLMVFTMTLSVYYLPVLSKLTIGKEIRKEIISGSKIIIPIVVISSSTVYYLREFVICFLFSDEFLPSIELIKWQMVGDTLKVASWLISFLMLAKAMVKVFLVSQFLSHFMFYFLTVFFVDSYGLVGVSYAHAANFLLYFLFVYVFVYRKIVSRI